MTQVKKEFDAASAFLASQPIETAYFVVNEGETGSRVWRSIELPILLKNPSIKRIIRVNAMDYGKSKEEILLNARIVFNRTKLLSKKEFADTINRILNIDSCINGRTKDEEIEDSVIDNPKGKCYTKKMR